MTDTVSEDVKLEPCPFCGARLQRQQTSSGHWHEHMGEVEDCYATGSIVFDENIAAWNRRAYLAATKPPLADVTEAQAAYALLWRTRTTDPAIHAARRSLLNTIGKDGQRAALQWALDTFGPTPEPSLEDMP